MVSLGAINGKLAAYVASPAGKRKIAQCIDDHKRSGEPFANGAKAVATEAEMREAANALMAMIRARLPESIASVGGSLSASDPVELSSGEYKCEVGFDRGALRRESLYTKNGYTGEGIDNIVALFNNGYRAANYVYGYWRGEGDDFDDSFGWVKSKKEREALHFMQDAVSEFNAAYGAQYNVTAVLGGGYTL